jgi:hypothetical protein
VAGSGASVGPGAGGRVRGAAVPAAWGAGGGVSRRGGGARHCSWRAGGAGGRRADRGAGRGGAGLGVPGLTRRPPAHLSARAHLGLGSMLVCRCARARALPARPRALWNVE